MSRTHGLFFEIRADQGGAFYNNVTSKITMSKSRYTVIVLFISKGAKSELQASSLVVKKRRLSEDERQERKTRRVDVFKANEEFPEEEDDLYE